MKSARKDIPVDLLRERFVVTADGELFWSNSPNNHPRWRGVRAGRINSHGSYTVTLAFRGQLRKLLAHRIVWAITHGEWPKQTIDHINRNPADNRPENLRDVSHSENMRNKSNNRPHIGVYPTAGGKFRAQIRMQGRAVYLGTFPCASSASAAIAKATGA